jgi:hypothetical protein
MGAETQMLVGLGTKHDIDEGCSDDIVKSKDELIRIAACLSYVNTNVPPM